jgi:NADPH:quinone reductase-like Zn-dependent oxidoreductase
MVTIASTEEAISDERVKRAFFIVEPRHDHLVEVAKLIDAGDLRPVVDTVVPFSEAPKAFSGDREKHGRRKLVVEIAERDA